MEDKITIVGARENNLKNISLEIPKNKLVVLTGVSGSGKSTIALKTLQTECTRQYMESLGMVTDEFIKPKVDYIRGLSPAISVSQRNMNRNPRSTVGTMTEVYTYLRLLFSKIGERPCPHCGETIVPSFQSESMDTIMPDEESHGFETMMACPHCKGAVAELTMSHFSFNKPQGACEKCNGIGVTMVPNIDAIVDVKRSINDYAVEFWDKFLRDRYSESVSNAADHYGFEADMDAAVGMWSEEAFEFLLYGALSEQTKQRYPDKKTPKTVPEGRFEGLVTNLQRRYSDGAGSMKTKEALKQYFHEDTCDVCNGLRLKRSSAQVVVDGINIIEISRQSIGDVYSFVKQIEERLTEEAMMIVRPIIEALHERLRRFIDVGVGYLSLERSAMSLSGGEAQRIRLASLLGSGLTGVLYVLDEPTTGLHSRDTKKLLAVIEHLRDLGNTVLVIEHDLEVIRAADYIIDIGPGAGENGGNVVVTGTRTEVIDCDASITGKYLSGERHPYHKTERRVGKAGAIHIEGANIHNLKNVDAKIPGGCLTAITGVSGSGKSSLIFDTLEAGTAKITGLDSYDRIISFDQSPIGRSSRSNVATYTDIYTELRSLFASLDQAKKHKLKEKHFSFNTSGGRCEKCEGLGVMMIPMHFMPDAEVTCPICRGKRFNLDVLSVKFKEMSISDILNCSVAEALGYFKEHKKIYQKLCFLEKVGLSYIKLGQPTSSLSGGEAQRIKLAKELGSQASGQTLYLLDEPTTGLHPDDINKLVAALNEIVDKGHTMVVIEHSLELIVNADYVIDFGPEGGDAGGEIIAVGTPEEVTAVSHSFTGQCLAAMS